jgi:hypothetical protein
MNKLDSGFVLRWAKKIKAIEYMGGKCSKCNETSIATLNFHHLGQKDNELTNMFRTKNWSWIVEELKLATMICENCHRAEHANPGSDYAKVKRLCLEYKNIFACQSCGFSGADCALDFCIGTGDESGTRISKMINTSWKTVDDLSPRIKQAIDSRIVLCGNCHMKNRFSVEADRFNAFKADIDAKILNMREVDLAYDRNATRNMAIDMKNSGKSLTEICNSLGVSKGTVHGWIKNMISTENIGA